MSPLNFRLPRTGTVALSAVGLGVVLTLSGCGGGDSDSINRPPIVSLATPEEIRSLAFLGYNSAYLIKAQTEERAALLGTFLASSLNNGALDGPSQLARSTPCAGASGGTGSFSVATAKLGAGVGVSAGDAVSLAFNNCRFATSGITINGSAVMRPQLTYSRLPAEFYSINFTAELSALDMRSASTRSIVSGTAGVVWDATNPSADGYSWQSISANQLESFTSPLAATAALSMRLGAGALTTGATGYNAVGASTQAANVNGNIALAANGSANTLNVGLVTPATVAGTINASSGQVLPTTGALRTTSLDTNLLTQVEFAGTLATLSGDADRNGSLDYSRTYPITSFLSGL